MDREVYSTLLYARISIATIAKNIFVFIAITTILVSKDHNF